MSFGEARGRTVLAEAERSPPWQAQRLLYLDPAHPSLARLPVLNGTAGLFAGDCLRLEVEVQAGAAVELVTPAMTRVFAMPAGEARVDIVGRVEGGAYLEYLPEPVLLCAGAALSQRTDIVLCPGASVAWGEVLAFGRPAHGEGHAYRSLKQRLVVARNDTPVLVEGLELAPTDASASPAVVGDYAAYGSLYMAAPTDLVPLLADVRELIGVAEGAYGGASLAQDGTGIAVRVLARTASDAQRVLRAAVARFRRRCGP